jgi:hypothetical protein
MGTCRNVSAEIGRWLLAPAPSILTSVEQSDRRSEEPRVLLGSH